MRTVMCGFCGTLNQDGEPRCVSCSHQPGVPRMSCECSQCKQRWNHPSEIDREKRAGFQNRHED